LSEDAGDYLDRIIDEERKKSESTPPSTVAPTLNDVLSGKKVIKKGQKGESVKEIKKMLYSMGYDDFVSQENKSNKSVNGNYDDSTELSVIAFQSFEGLKESGVVNMETLTKIIKQYKKQ
jgi:peptidoglycan hydrolase-like protein with peptidoglycan-binding domain